MAILGTEPREVRTVEGKYVRTQATCQDATLKADYDIANGEIHPGTVMSHLGNGVVVPCDGSMAPYGISNHWWAPSKGINEIPLNGLNKMGVWLGGSDAGLGIAYYDTAAAWDNAVANDLAAGKNVFLKSNAKGQLTLEDTPTEATENTFARLLGKEGKILYISFANSYPTA